MNQTRQPSRTSCALLRLPVSLGTAALTTDRVGLTDLYLQRADSENAYDELRNQWGWGGFRLLSGVERSSGRTEKTADDAQLGVRIIRRRTIVRE